MRQIICDKWPSLKYNLFVVSTSLKKDTNKSIQRASFDSDFNKNKITIQKVKAAVKS